MSKKLALGYLKVGDYFIYDGKEYKAGRLIENTNGYVACVDKDKKVRRIYIDTLVEKVVEKMTRRNILNKYGFKYMSQVELDAELSEEEAIKFEEFIKELNDKFKLDELLQSGEEIEIEIKVGGIDE